MQGFLIVLEGPDRCGKTTLSHLLSKYLSAPVLKYPNRDSVLGKIIDKHLRKEEIIESPLALHYLFCANRAENLKNLEDFIKNHDFVILDRYKLSNSVYSSVKNHTDFGFLTILFTRPCPSSWTCKGLCWRPWSPRWRRRRPGPTRRL